MSVISVETAVLLAVKKDYKGATAIFEEYFNEYYKAYVDKFEKEQVAERMKKLHEARLKEGLFSRSQKEMATEAVFAVFRETKSEMGIIDESGRARIRLAGFEDI